MKVQEVQDNLQTLSHLLMDAAVLADDIYRQVKNLPDSSGTERSNAGSMSARITEAYGSAQYLIVALRP